VKLPEETWREAGFYWGYRALEAIALRLPERAGRSTFSTIGGLAYRRLPGLRATVAANQARVLGLEPEDPRVQASTREAFELYGRFWYDAFKIRALTLQEVNERTEMVDIENLQRALDGGRGAICALPHMGNWDLAGHYLAANGFRIAAVGEQLKPARLTEIFMAHRRELGLKMIALTKEGHVGSQLKQLLADNWIVALVADRDLGGRGVLVEMFGARCRLPAGPALLSLSTGAPLIVSPTSTTRRGWRIRMQPALEIERTGSMRDDVAALTQALAREFERAISSNPPDWHMFQPMWVDVAAAEPAAVAP
jgi:KDO2-lipid IV(A) lauroyltransferase